MDVQHVGEEDYPVQGILPQSCEICRFFLNMLMMLDMQCDGDFHYNKGTETYNFDVYHQMLSIQKADRYMLYYSIS